MSWHDLAASDEVQAADWIRERLHPFAQDVGSVVPPGFAAYARIFHPAWQPGADANHVPVEVRWSDVAAWNGKTVHSEMQFHAIGGPWQGRSQGQGPRVQEPSPGVLSRRQVGALVGLLSKRSATPDVCWLCLWEGYGYLKPAAFPRTLPVFSERKRVTLPGRGYLLFKGAVAAAQGWEDGPNLWWPNDRARCDASDIDLPYTYVGGTTELIEGILHHPALEALPATVEDRITATSDTINS